MSVRYDVVFKDGRKLARNSICFGGMASGGWGGGELEARPANQQAFIQFHIKNNMHPMWSWPFPEIKRDWNPAWSQEGKDPQVEGARLFLQEMKELYNDLPLLKGVITIHPLLGVVRAHIKRHKADKIILALMLFRNLANYSNNCFTYRHFRNQGYRPRAAVILAHLINCDIGVFGARTWGDQWLSEYNWINPDCFGKQALIKMIHCDEVEDEWPRYHQQPWSVQRGYRREREWVGNSAYLFDDRYRGLQWNYATDTIESQYANHNNIHKYLNLVDA
ncbi:hypothetical protein, partial [Herbiconiux daphne]